MKLLYCLLCKNLLQMDRSIKECDCLNIKQSCYLEDGFTVAVAAKDYSKVRVIGIANIFLENGHMHFDDGLPGGFNDGNNPNSMFYREQSPIVSVPVFTTGDVIPWGRRHEISERTSSKNL